MNSKKLYAMVKKYGKKLPPPPLPGTDKIQPIDSVRELLLEGQIMHHCVGSYIENVLSGDWYIYRIMEPERATLGILLDDMAGIWAVAQLKSYSNSTPSADVVELVYEWLVERQPLLAAKIADKQKRAI